ncbi:DgyrCDS180 [Dimorphilus gyrociliatus]|uniref:DgyrCDS180 n=1 Tax=Dimorphilus gyrociliatus TaxID=2664684 RepID=A0A7I8V867_9ANNE|nr:DgyrCDS180 [Dimorphilus gyrociliatus]
MRGLLIVVCLFQPLLAYAPFFCRNMRQMYTQKGFPMHHIENRPKTLSNSICRLRDTCCSNEVEKNLQKLSVNDTGRMFNNYMSTYKNEFVSKHAQIDSLFNKLHKNTMDVTHKYLDIVYGLLYVKHKDIFFDFLSDLLYYYKNEGKESLKDRIERFFDTLYVALFHIKFNGGTFKPNGFPEKFNNCVKRTRKTIKPFKKEQEEAVIRLLEKFMYPSKTFVQALRVGRDFILDVIKEPFGKDCSNSLTRLEYCKYCRDESNAKPCYTYCSAVMNGCFTLHHKLQLHWNEYAKQLKKLKKRFIGDKSAQKSMDTLHMKFSDMIMNFQESGNIKETVVMECGQLPPLQERAKRAVRKHSIEESEDDEIYFTAEKKSFSKRSKKTSIVDNINEIMDEIDKFLPRTNEMFGKPLTETMCTSLTKFDQVENCWNGHTVDRYKATAGDLRSESNPEVNIYETKLEVDEDRLTKRLKEITIAMEKAYNGEEYLFKSVRHQNKFHFSHVNNQHELVGSGSGSGYNQDWERDDDGTEDDYEDNYSGDATIYKNKHHFNKHKVLNSYNDYRKNSYNNFGHKSFQNDEGNNACSLSASFSIIFITFLTAYPFVVS